MVMIMLMVIMLLKMRMSVVVPNMMEIMALVCSYTIIYILLSLLTLQIAVDSRSKYLCTKVQP